MPPTRQHTQPIGGGGALSTHQRRPLTATASSTSFSHPSQRTQRTSTRPISSISSVRPAQTSRVSPVAYEVASADGPFSARTLSSTRPQPISTLISTRPVPMTQQLLEHVPVAEEHAYDCICSICNCGRHACPPTPRVNHYPSNMSSEARSAYNGVFVPAKRASVPYSKVRDNVPFEGVSTNKADFQDWGTHPNRSPARSASFMNDTGIGRSNAPFLGNTTNKNDYKNFGPNAKRASPSETAKKSNIPIGEAKDNRDFTSENRAQYQPKPLPLKHSKPPTTLADPLPFEGVSTQHTDFQPFLNARPSIPMHRGAGYHPLPEDRDFASENKKQFIPKEIQACPAIPVMVHTKPRPGHVWVEKDPKTKTYHRLPW